MARTNQCENVMSSLTCVLDVYGDEYSGLHCIYITTTMSDS